MKDTEEICILDKRMRLLQPVKGFRTSLDSVMLAASCPAKEGQKILDLGCGVGGAGLCVLARVQGATLTGIDLQGDHIDLAQENARLNTMEERCRFSCLNVKDFQEENAFDHVICNPPYMDAGTHIASPVNAKAMAHSHEEETSLKDWVDAAFHALKSKGSLSIIHRADQVDRIIQALGKRFGATEIIPLWPYEGQAAKRVIVRTIKNRRSPAKIHSGLVLHKEGGDYSAAANEILRNMAAL